MQAKDLTRRTTVNDVEIAWDAWGPDGADTLVLCHGFSGSGCDFALHVDALVDAGLRVVLLDQRGHGRSGWSDPSRYRIQQLADDLVALLPHMSDRPVHLLGHSMGGRVVLAAALQTPDLLRSLVLMDTSATDFRHPDPEVAAMVGGFIEAYDPAAGLPVLDLSGPEDDLVRARLDPDVLAHRLSVQKRLDPHALKELGLELFGGRFSALADRLASLTIPATVVVGSLDVPYAAQAPDLAALVRGELVVIEGAFHSPQLTHGQEWVDALVTHVQRTTLDTLT